MEATREIYWNVNHGLIWVMYLFAFLALGGCAWGFRSRLPLYRQGKPLDRLDRLSLRLKHMARGALTQAKVLRVPVPGTLHAFFFWGFLLLFIGTLLIMLQADFTAPLLAITFLKGTFYKAYSLVLDLAGIIAILMLGGLFVRRFLVRPPALPTKGDDYLAHALLFTILVTGFVVESLRMAATEVTVNPELARFSPGGLLLAPLFSGMDLGSISVAHKALWWVHFFLAMGFIVAIPFTKLRHLFTDPANYLFTDLRPKGAIATINLEDESAEQFGAAKATDLAWKDIYDADACTLCRRCQDRCPAWNTEKPLSPMRVVQQVGEMALNDPQGDLCRYVTEEVLWDCTTCRACQEICPVDIEHVNKILEMRRNLALMEGSFPGDEVRTAMGNYEVNGNPFGLAWAERGAWAEGLDVVTLESGEPFDVMYFVGCYASFDRRNKEVAKAFAKICSAAGIRLGILGKEEKCCGEPPRKLGNEYLYQTMAQENIERIKGYGVREIVTTCPHCFNALARDYRDLGLEIPVRHYTSLLAELLEQGRLKLDPGEGFDCTYHDSCYIGRYADIFEPPREILERMGGNIAEMDRNRRESFCCGGGGGRILAEEKVGTRISTARVQMAGATRAPMLVSNCPFCLTMFEDGIKTGGLEGNLAARDLAELVAARLSGSGPGGACPLAS
ncbi:4Fe-4S dicluster domain-containing protein [Geomonas sp. Red69]|uniref:heterodisulfide reductase-related iron-sulfur binding cluster n=1 Tax=Geomonas diazotrophica TaxID=2843197 RepID=UPI001C10B72F|nr:heterodisulfide reductase-related iron-sulfur binding cluster [Geomonas diazotrophica]MBU5636779.1 4Fe-4S dicluster domain-containing protein [Geomonas diazotrophica]